ncbi:MAG: hypothetical protein E7085_08330 [Parabacteroides distasonis]|nr:hypothetical protein [Parabacteroides distasonis]
MKKLMFWLMSLALLCSCTNSIEEVAVNSSDELKTKSGLPTITVTFSFLIDQSVGTPPNLLSYAQAHCSMNPEISFERIEFPLYNVWQWDNTNWVKLYLSDLISFNGTGDYLTGLPLMAGAVTSVYEGDIKIYPESLGLQYNFVYETIGLPLVYNLPGQEEPGPGEGDPIEDNYDSLMKIKKPIILITE